MKFHAAGRKEASSQDWWPLRCAQELLLRGKSRAVFPPRAVSVLSDGVSVSKAKEADESCKGRSVGLEQQLGHQAWQRDSGSRGAQTICGSLDSPMKIKTR